MLAVFGNVIAGLFCAAAPNPNAVDDPALGGAIICASHGGQTPSDDGTAPPAPNPPCQICITVAAFALVYALVAISLLLPQPARTRLAAASVPILTSGLRPGGLGSRAPPLPA